MHSCLPCCHSSANHKLSRSHIGKQISRKRVVHVALNRVLTFPTGRDPQRRRYDRFRKVHSGLFMKASSVTPQLHSRLLQLHIPTRLLRQQIRASWILISLWRWDEVLRSKMDHWPTGRKRKTKGREFLCAVDGIVSVLRLNPGSVKCFFFFRFWPIGKRDIG
jgi:hypothetical protein